MAAPAVVTARATGPVPVTKQSGVSFAARRAQARFEELLRPHLDHLYRLAYRFTGTADRAEDLIQDLLVRVYPRCEELAHLDKPRPWLARVLYRLFVDQRRRETRAPVVSMNAGPISEEGDESGEPGEWMADSAPGPEMELEMKLDRERLLQAWEALNPDHRALIALFEVEGYTLEELEEMLEVNRGTLKSRLHRARAQLTQLLSVEEPLDTLDRVKSRRLGNQ